MKGESKHVLTERVRRLQTWALVLEVKLAEDAGYTDDEVESWRLEYLEPDDLPNEPAHNTNRKDEGVIDLIDARYGA